MLYYLGLSYRCNGQKDQALETLLHLERVKPDIMPGFILRSAGA